MNASSLLVDPTAPIRPHGSGGSRRLESLQGKVVGFIDNAKPNFSYLAADIADILQQEHGVRSATIHRKMAASVPAQAQAIEELASNCDLVITGSGD